MTWEIGLVLLATLSFGLAQGYAIKANSGLSELFALALCFVDILIISLVIGG